MAVIFAILLVHLLTGRPGDQIPAGDVWSRADAQTARLSPAAFPQLSAAIRTELHRRGCTVPQAYTGGAPHNVIRGAFRTPGVIDVAVLCSRGRTSGIVVFWGADPRQASELAVQSDAVRLQVVGPDRIGYSRLIKTASQRFMRGQHQRHNIVAPLVEHDGIDDAFLEKGSMVWCWREGKWIQLAGTD
jgi:hypothetical protein